MDLGSVSLGAASAVTQNYAAMNAATSAVAQDPGPGTVSAQTQSGTQAQFSMGVLKQTLDIQASVGAQLAQMIGQGSGVDITA
jgi:hypothetical protein